MVLVQSQEASTPWAWKMFFWSFLTKTKQDQALPSHFDGKFGPRAQGVFSVGYFILGHPVCVNTKECEREKALDCVSIFYSILMLTILLIVNVCIKGP